MAAARVDGDDGPHRQLWLLDPSLTFWLIPKLVASPRTLAVSKRTDEVLEDTGNQRVLAVGRGRNRVPSAPKNFLH